MLTVPVTAAERLLDAAREQLRDEPWATVTMAAVADRAGVSRQTLYKTFGTREQLAQALLLREVSAFLTEVEHELTAAEGEADRALEAAFARFLAGVQGNPLVRAIVVDQDPDLLATVVAQEIDVVGFAAARLAVAIGERWPEVSGADVDLLADNLVRLAFSHAMFPPAPKQDVADGVRLLLGPFVAQALGR